jgi:adenosylcobinamide kinase/adenosylcobinamide-phosphate guanylyltransferase
MEKRICLHQQSRPKHWKTFEEPIEIATHLKKINNIYECVIIDCLTLWISNLMLAGHKETDILKIVDTILADHKSSNSKIIMVANEVGLGVVPTNKLARDFRDIAGKVNQRIAQEAHEVFFMISGLPAQIKRKDR